MSCHVRDGFLDTFFSHEYQNFPPSLSTYGDIRTGTKSDILQCLEKMSPSQNDRPDVDMLLLDGSVIVNMPRPRAMKIFHKYSQQVFLLFLKSQLDIVSRVDIVWYVHIPDSLKFTVRKKTWNGNMQTSAVQPDNKIPNSWQEFLRFDENKAELFFHYLSQESITVVCSKDQKSVSTLDKTILTSSRLHALSYTSTSCSKFVSQTKSGGRSNAKNSV